MGQRLERSAGGAPLPIGVFPNVFKLVLECEVEHCLVGKSPVVFQQIVILFF